jgi:hypothetical protein
MKRTVFCIWLLSMLASLRAESQPLATVPPVVRNILVDFELPLKNAPQSVLASSALRVRLNGKQVRVTKAERVNLRPRIVILLDESGSMGDPAIWNGSIDLATAAFSALRSSDVFFLRFSDQKMPLNAQPFTEDLARELQFKKVALKVKTKPAKGHTAARDAIVYAIRKLNLKLGDALLLISDGGENASRSSDKEMDLELFRSGVRIFSLAIGDLGVGMPEDIASPLHLRRLAVRTGGIAEQVTINVKRMSVYSRIILKPEKMAELTEYIGWRIAHPIMLTLDLPESASGKLQVDAIEASGRRLKDVQVTAPDRIEAISVQGPE